MWPRDALVSDEQLVDVLPRVLVDLLEPALHVRERLLVGDVVDHDDAMRAPVVGAADGAEPLLPRRVPYLQLDALAVELDRADLLLAARRTGG